jgi:hypothetical protein
VEDAADLIEQGAELLHAGVAELAGELQVLASRGLVELVQDRGTPAGQDQQG